jgi:hypothetical protein
MVVDDSYMYAILRNGASLHGVQHRPFYCSAQALVCQASGSTGHAQQCSYAASPAKSLQCLAAVYVTSKWVLCSPRW